MVGCDLCDAWVHFGCAGVTASIENHSWKCDKCKEKILEDTTQRSVSSRTSSVSSKASQRVQLRLQMLEEQRQLRLKVLEEEEAARKKRAAEEEAARRKRAQEEAEFIRQKYELLMDETPSDLETYGHDGKEQNMGENIEKWLDVGRGLVGPVTSPPPAVEGRQTQQEIMPPSSVPSQPRPDTFGQTQVNAAPTSTSTPQAYRNSVLIPIEASASGFAPETMTSINQSQMHQSRSAVEGLNTGLRTSFGAEIPKAATVSFNPQISYVANPAADVQPTWMNNYNTTPIVSITQPIITCQSDFIGQQYPTYTAANPTSGPGAPVGSMFVPGLAPHSHDGSQWYNWNQRQPAVSQTNRFGVTNSYNQPGPSAVQIAARQVMSRDLPKFTGDPEGWPMFRSAFYNTTQACGYSHAENLSRLQRSLDGPALVSVKSRLLLPESVPQVMDTLEKLYGRPEILIHSLLKKLRDVPAPKTENLRSIIDFGLAVQNLVDHMTIAKLTEHLCNPMLLHELVEKLPAFWKMQWSSFKQTRPEVNLATFSSFMSVLVSTASDVTLPDLSTPVSTKIEKGVRNKSKLFVHSDTIQSSREAPKEKREEPAMKTCTFCTNASHEIASCSQFKALDIDARWKAMRLKGLCRICLVPHRRWPCRSGKVCEIDGCRLRHHALLHSHLPPVTQSSAATQGNVAHQNHHLVLPCTLFRYLPIVIENNGRKVHTFAFLDDGSSSTLLEAGIAAELGVEGPTDSLFLTWTGNVSREEKQSQRVSIVVSGRGLKNQFKLNNVRTVQRLKLPSQNLQYERLIQAYPHLKGLPIQSYSNAVPGMIVGVEHARLLSTLKIREGRETDPIAAKTRLGWCVFGKQAGGEDSVQQLSFHGELRDENRHLHELMKQFFGIEEASVTIKPEAEEDTRALQILQETTQRVSKGFECGLLWKFKKFSFPDSFPMAVKRAVALERKLAKNPVLKGKVSELIASYEEKGYAHRITEDELQTTQRSKVWYLPLGFVQNPKKPEKVRLIWDAAARVEGVSFNDMLLKGPDMLVSLFAVLLRFRQKNVAICGDIREMFHQISIRSPDNQAQRFLYKPSPDRPPQIYVMDVATFGATCSPCQAQYVKNQNANDLADRYPTAAEAIIKAHYVDDYLDSTDTVDEAVQLLSDVKYVHSQGGFEIRNFCSNSTEVLRRMGQTKSPDYKSMNLDQTNDVERVLGMVWRPIADVFSFDISIRPDILKLLDESIVPTKREVLRTVMSLFDPLGLLAHYIIQGKILMQDIWRSGTDWDEPITENLRGQWYRWSQLLWKLNTVQVPRCFFSGVSKEALNRLQIHVFVDASDTAYSCVAYLRIVESGAPRCSLVAAKTKVAPLKPLSIPRLELQAAMIGSRLINSLCTSLNLQIKQRFLWVDSSTVLAWLRSDSRRYHPFVAFRIGEILSLTTVNEWHKIRSKRNVADEATKWGSGPQFDPESRWYKGPSFLWESEEDWPAEEQHSVTTVDLRASFLHVHVVKELIIDVDRFSTWERLVRTIAYVQRAAKNFRRKTATGILTNNEWRAAENLLWKQVQMQNYPDEYTVLHNNKLNTDKEPMFLSKDSPLHTQSPFLDDDGVIRMNSRISAAPTTPYEAKFPILLPKGQRVITLLVDSYHRRFLHGNNETVFNEMRQQFRIPHLRSVIKQVARVCQRCRIKKAVPLPPMMAPLPQQRLTPFVKPFSHTGVDYFGPVLVKQGRSLVKRWIVLFTCLTIRAVHLEVAYSLSTQSCVMAIRRFIARRGSPETFYSDNGTNFIGANRLLIQQLRTVHESCAVTFTNAKTSWRFNPPLAPHMGGPWERMVRSVKSAMAEIADYHKHPSDEVLETVILEAESVINSRPLTYVPLDSEEGDALTPNHFLLYGTKGVQQPSRTLTDQMSNLRDSHTLAQNMVDRFWQRWVSEYLPDLTRRTKWHQPTRPLQPGDVVLVVDESRRNGWTKGRVIDVQKAKDGQVRSAVVRTVQGVIKRPAVKLALLEVAGTEGIPKESQGASELHGRGDVVRTPALSL